MQHFFTNLAKSGNPAKILAVSEFQPDFGKMAGYQPELEPNSGTALLITKTMQQNTHQKLKIFITTKNKYHIYSPKIINSDQRISR